MYIYIYKEFYIKVIFGYKSKIEELKHNSNLFTIYLFLKIMHTIQNSFYYQIVSYSFILADV